MVVVGTKIDRMKRMKRPNAIAMLAKGKSTLLAVGRLPLVAQAQVT